MLSTNSVDVELNLRELASSITSISSLVDSNHNRETTKGKEAKQGKARGKEGRELDACLCSVFVCDV